MPIQRIVKQLKTNDFLKSVSVLMTGTIIAQGIGYALAPLISRLFTPNDVGDFAIFSRLTVLLTTIATARYEYSIPIAKNDDHSFHLFRLSLRIAFVSSAISVLLFFFYFLLYDKNSDNLIWGLFVVLTAFTLVFFNIGTNWSIRNKQFTKISISKMTSSFGTNVSRVIFGFLNLGKWGLIFSFLIGSALSSLHFVADYIKNKNNGRHQLSRKKMRILSRIYKDFPIANLPHALTDSLRDLLVAYMLTELYSKAVCGSFDHSFRMLRLPIMLFGVSMGQVFFNKISESIHTNKPILPQVQKMLLMLTGIGIIPFMIVFFIGGNIFAFVFGHEWYQAGKLSEIMAPWLFLNFITSPLSTLPLVLNKQKSFFVIGILLSFAQVVGFAVFPYFIGDMKTNVYAVFRYVTIGQVLISLISVWYFLKIAQDSDYSKSVDVGYFK